jgi:hypothetical protein
MGTPETSNAPKTVPQTTQQLPTSSQPVVFFALQITPSVQQIAPSAQKIAKDLVAAYFTNDGIPQEYHTVSSFSGNYAQNPGYQGASGYNYIPQQAPNQYMQPAGANTDDLVNRLANVIQNQFGLKPKEQSYMYQCPYPEWFDRVALPARY